MQVTQSLPSEESPAERNPPIAPAPLRLPTGRLSLRDACAPHARLVGSSAVMRHVRDDLARIAHSDATVLIQGETGTGKELAARSVHDTSARAAGPYVVVDCGALPETMLEAELFGHSRGAFTGAHAARPGAIEAGNGGTVFLDEVGELPLSMQPKLLRVLESRTVRRLGENEQRAVDVRFISATNRDLGALLDGRTFRSDLYFRLAVLVVNVPPLREHISDIPELVSYFLGSLAPEIVGREMLRDLMARPWAGNVRELRNVLERAVTLGAGEALHGRSRPRQPPASDLGSEMLDLPFKEARRRGLGALERQYVEGILARHDRNVRAAAEASGIDRTYLHRLIRRHGLATGGVARK